MSTCISKDISCPSCGAVHKTQMWPGIDRIAHPELRAKIMEETFFDWKCPRCGYTAQMTYPCLYHDRELGLMICLAPGSNKITLEIPPYLDNVAKRGVSTLPQLKEKILLFESGLDDAAMELVKKALSEVVQRKWRIPEVTAYFCASNKKQIEFAFYWQGQQTPVYHSTRFDVYKQAKEVLKAVQYQPEGGFPVVDSLLAYELMEAYQELEE